MTCLSPATIKKYEGEGRREVSDEVTKGEGGEEVPGRW